MAKTLADYKKEFAALQKLVTPTADEIDELENNVGRLREYIMEGFTVVGARIAELRAQGHTGDQLEDYLDDNEVKPMVTELQQRLSVAKTTAAKAAALRQDVRAPILARMKTLRANLAAEITARDKKTSSKALGLNQSVKEMKSLETEIDKYCKSGSPAFATVFNFKGTFSADQFQTLYTSLAAEQLAKSVKEVRAAEKDVELMQRLNDKVMRSVNLKIRNAAGLVIKQGQAGQAAQKARDGQALGRAKQTATAALKTVTDLVAPYKKLMKSSKVQQRLILSPDKALIDKAYQTMVDNQAKAEEAYETLTGRTLV